MCNLCTPTARVLGPQPSRRPKANPGHHSPGTRTERLEILCSGTETRVWWTTAGIRCVECWHTLDSPLADPLDIALRKRFRTDLGQRNNLIADDFDDSDAGLRELAIQLSTLHPYLRLNTAGRRASLFRAASFQHSIIALDGAAQPLSTLVAIGTTLEAKLAAEIDHLLKAAIK